MEVDFPRGKPDIQKAKRPIIRDDKTGKSKRKKLDKDNADSTNRKASKDKFAQIWSKSLSQRTLNPNIIAYGCISAVLEHELKVEIADRITVTVPKSKISDVFSQQMQVKEADQTALCNLYAVGQIMIVKIVDSEIHSNGSRSLRTFVATTEPKEINENLMLTQMIAGQIVMASVKSVEDKGLLMDLGSPKVSGFLPFDKCGVKPAASDFITGQTFPCLIDQSSSSSKARVIKLTRVAYSKPEMTPVIRRQQLLPGVKIDGVIEKIVGFGVYLRFGEGDTNKEDSCFYGFVSDSKLPLPFQNAKRTLEVGATIRCVITYTEPQSHVFGLSARCHLTRNERLFFDPKAVFGELEIGQKRKGICKLVSERGKTVYFRLLDGTTDSEHNEESAVFGICSFNKLEHVENTDGSIRIEPSKYMADKSKHRLRIVGRSFVSGLLYVSDSSTILKQPIVDVDHARVGVTVDATVTKVIERGLCVKLYDSIVGFVPTLYVDHRTEGRIIKKYPPGTVIQARVLNVEPRRNRLILTARKAQLKSVDDDKDILSSYDPKYIGTVHVGIIIHAMSSGRGLLVAFYNQIKGYLDLNATDADIPKSSFYVGQALSVRVESVDVEQSRMSLSLAPNCKLNAQSGNQRELTTIPLADDGGPTSFDVRVEGVTKQGLRVAAVGSGVKGFVPPCHLTDGLGQWSLLAATYEPGDTFGPCVVFAPGREPIFSAKPAVVKAVLDRTNPIRFEQLETGKLVVGVVSRVHDDLGYFVDLARPFDTETLPSGLASHGFVDKSEDGLGPVLGQTVVGRITRVDVEQRRFRLTLKTDECAPQTGALDLCVNLLRGHFHDCDRLRTWLRNRAHDQDPRRQLLEPALAVGAPIAATVNNVTQFGLICTLENGLRGVAVTEQLSKPVDEYSEDDKIEAVVLRHDLDSCCVELSTLDWLLKSVKKHQAADKSAATATDVKIDQRITARLVLNKPDAILVVLADHSNRRGLMAYLPGRMHFNDVREHSRRIVGQKLSVLVKGKYNVDDDGVFILAQDVENEKLSIKRDHRISIDSNDMPVINALKNIVTVQVGKVYTVEVMDRNGFYLNLFVNKSQKARMHVSELKDTWKNGENAFEDETFTAGRAVNVKVIGFSRSKDDAKIRIADCSAKQSKLASRNNKQRNIGYKSEFHKKDLITVFLDELQDNKCTFVVIPGWSAFCQLIDLSDDTQVLNDPKRYFTKGSAFNAQVVAVDNEHKRLVVKIILNQRPISAGRDVICQLTAIEPGHRLLFKMPDSTQGVCYFTDICSNFDNVANETSKLKIGQFLTVRVVNLLKSNCWRVALRTGGVDAEESAHVDPVVDSLDNLSVGQRMRGFIRKILAKGCLVTLGPKICGRLPFAAPVNYVTDQVKPEIGSIVEVALKSVDKASGKIFLKWLNCGPVNSKKRKKDDAGLNSETESAAAVSADSKRSRTDSVTADAIDQCLPVAGGFDFMPAKFSMKNMMEVGLQAAEATTTSPVDDDDADDGADSSGWDSDGSDKKTSEWKAAKKQLRKQKKNAEKDVTHMNEEELLQKEMELLNPDRPLETADDFDRLLMGNPNSSMLWLRYMALFLRSEDIAKARLVAERALKTINLRQEEERFNIWAAMLNLENSRGSDDSLRKTFERARQVCDPSKIYRQLLRIYQRSNKVEAADEVVEDMLKRLKTDFNVWLWAGEHFYACEPKRPDKARELIKRAAGTFLRCLPTNPEEKRVDLISRFAQMEFKHADTERAKTLFESLLSQYPKRIDLWCVYADMVAKYRNSDEARVIFERATSLKLPFQKLKSMYQKWLDFEQRHGADATCIQQVQDRLDALQARLKGES